MVAVMKEICIFVMIAQAVMFFVPGDSYMKYVRILVGILMILKITEPVLGLILDEEKEKEISERIWRLEQEIDLKSNELELTDNSRGIYEGIKEELKKRLNDCESGYEVLDVELTEDQKLVIRLASKEAGEPKENMIQIEPVVIGKEAAQDGKREPEEEEELKKIFGSCMSVEAERIEIVFDG